MGILVSILMYSSFSSTTSLYHVHGGMQTFLQDLQEHRKDSWLEGSKSRWQCPEKTPRQVHFNNLKDEIGRNHVMTKPGNDERYKDQSALLWIHDGLQKEFQICN